VLMLIDMWSNITARHSLASFKPPIEIGRKMNKSALPLCSGVAVNSPDSAGNKPLHYAAKHGHPELCKLLVGKGAFPGARNNTGQTAYDVADNHIVRQYLLPLQFQDERESSDSNGEDYCQSFEAIFLAPSNLL
jgi:Ankyrin repeats (many copies)